MSNSYSDGAYIPAANRPNARQVSNRVGKTDGTIPLNKLNLTNLFTIWGQFVDHDITLTPFQKGDNAEDYSIDIPRGDPDFDP